MQTGTRSFSRFCFRFSFYPSHIQLPFSSFNFSLKNPSNSSISSSVSSFFLLMYPKTTLFFFEFQRNAFVCCLFIIGKITAADIAKSGLFQHLFHNVVAVCNNGNIQIFPAEHTTFFLSLPIPETHHGSSG